MSASHAGQRVSEGARGRTREEKSPVLPGEQAAFQFWDATATMEATSRAYEVMRQTADLETRKKIAIAVGKTLSYESKVSEGLNRANGVHVQLDWVIAQLVNNPTAAALIIECLTGIAGFEMPERRVKLTETERLRALLRELEESGSVGNGVIERAAKRIGTDAGAFRK